MILLKATIENSRTGYSSFIEHESGVIVACGKTYEGTQKELESAWKFHVEEMPEYQGEFGIDYTFSLCPPTFWEKVKCKFGIHKTKPIQPASRMRECIFCKELSIADMYYKHY